jgi:spermidine dehydrogenase
MQFKVPGGLNNDDHAIARRDFIMGVASIALASQVPVAQANDGPAAASVATSLDAPPAASPTPGAAYPPTRTGLRGQYPGSFEVAHMARDGGFAGEVEAQDTGEKYDLVVVGAGISGLSAAYFYRQAMGPDSKILILDNHDDFGGHAKRNEFHHDGRMYLGYGGTMSIESPFPYSYTAKALIADLGIDVASYSKHENERLYAGLKRGVFFDKEHFGADRLVAGVGERPWPELFAAAPLSPAIRADLTRIHTERVDYLAALSTPEKIAKLKHMSYGDYLTQCAKLLPGSVAFFSGMAFRNNMRVDTCPAYTAARSGAIGFQGLNLPEDPMFHSDYEFHFPDGNATIARLLVSRLVPKAIPGRPNMESVVTAIADYGALDAAANSTRIRLQSTVIRVEHANASPASGSVRVV